MAILSTQGESRDDAIKAQIFDRMNRIYRMGKDNIVFTTNISPSGDYSWFGNISCSSCQSCLKFFLSSPFIHMIAARSFHHQHVNTRAISSTAINSFNSLLKIGGLGSGDVLESLRVAVGQWKPTALDLHHDAMAR